MGYYRRGSVNVFHKFAVTVVETFILRAPTGSGLGCLQGYFIGVPARCSLVSTADVIIGFSVCGKDSLAMYQTWLSSFAEASHSAVYLTRGALTLGQHVQGRSA